MSDDPGRNADTRGDASQESDEGAQLDAGTEPDVGAEPDGGTVDVRTPGGSVASAAETTLGWRALADRTLAVATREYRLATRRRWTLGAAVVFAAFTLGVVGFGTSGVGPARYDAVLASLVELGVYLVPLVGLAVGYDAVVGSEASGSLALVRSLPTPAWTVVVGTYAGRAAALGGAVLVGFAPGLALAVFLVGPGAVGPSAVVVLAALLAASGFLAVGVLVSTVASERTHALGAALAAWLWFVLLHDLVALGAVAGLDLSGGAVALAVLANPADCFRVLALSPFDVVAGGLGAAVREAGLSVGLTAAGALAWVVGPVALAARLVGRR